MPRPLAQVLVVALVVLPAAALAKPKVALVPIDDNSGDVQEAVVDALDGGELNVVTPKQVARTEDKLGFEGDLSEKELKKLAAELEADAVIQGSLSMKGPNHVLHFKLFVKGKKQKGFKIEFGSAKSPKFKKALHDKMVAKLGDIGGGDDSEASKPTKKKKGDKVAKGDDDAAGGDDDTKPTKKKKGDKGGDDDAASGGDDDDTSKKKRTASADGDDGDSDDSVRASADLAAASTRAANRAAIRIDLGISVTGRTMSYNSRNFTGTGLGPPRTYQNAPVPGGRVEGEFYPLALSNPSGALAGLGLGGNYDKTFSLTLHNQLQPGTAFAADEFRWNVGARYRLAFGHKPTSPTLTFGFDYGHRQFKVDRKNQMDGLVIDLPDVQYVGVTPSLTFRLPVAASVALFAGGGSLLALRAGSIQQPEQYGQAKITSIEADAGIDIVFAKRYAVRFTGEFALFGFSFKGNGAMSNARDGDPTTIDVGGAADRYIGGAATFGVMY